MEFKSRWQLKHFSSYSLLNLSLLFFRSLHDNRVFFKSFLNLAWNEFFSQSPPQTSIWSQWLFTRQNWYEQDFCRLFFRKSKAQWWTYMSHRTRKECVPHQRCQHSCEVLHLTEISESGSQTTFCKQDFENHCMATQHGATCRVLRDAVSSLLPSQYFVQLSGQPPQNSFSHIKAMVRCSWTKVLGNMNFQNWPCDRLLRTAVFFHIWETSLWICCVFLY